MERLIYAKDVCISAAIVSIIQSRDALGASKGTTCINLLGDVNLIVPQDTTKINYNVVYVLQGVQDAWVFHRGSALSVMTSIISRMEIAYSRAVQATLFN